MVGGYQLYCAKGVLILFLDKCGARSSLQTLCPLFQFYIGSLQLWSNNIMARITSPRTSCKTRSLQPSRH